MAGKAMSAAELDAAVAGIPWGKAFCILKAAAKFFYCETNGGTDCVETLVKEIRACK